MIAYREEGHTLEETKKVYKVAFSTIGRWEHQWKEEGHLARKELKRAHKKIDPEKLTQYIKEHPDAYLIEIAEAFECSDSAISKACKRLKITRKKRR